METIKKMAVGVTGDIREVTVPRLPEDALLLVFRLLDWRDWLLAAGVCREWRSAALHPSLWCRVGFNCTFKGLLPARAALGTAPCLHHLRLGHVVVHAATVAALRDTSCGIAELDVDLSGSSVTRKEMSDILQRQVELGRLRKLNLRNAPRQHLPEWLSVVLETSSGCGETGGGLTELELWVRRDPQPRDASTLREPVVLPTCPSLRTLLYSSQVYGDTLLESLVLAHADVLERVEVRGTGLSTLAAKRLSACPQLRGLDVSRCPVPHVAKLDVPPCLADLSLQVTSGSSIDRLLPFFRGATQLARLRFVQSDVPKAVDLLAALGASGGSALRELHVGRTDGNTPVAALLRLPAILPGLAHLRELHLEWSMPPQGMFGKLTAAAAPSLRLLAFVPDFGRLDCGSECSFPALRDAVVRNPRLHIANVPLHRCTDYSASCEVCHAADHPVYQMGDADYFRHYSLFGHSEAGAEPDECGLEWHRDRPAQCQVSNGNCKCQHEWLRVN